MTQEPGAPDRRNLTSLGEVLKHLPVTNTSGVFPGEVVETYDCDTCLDAGWVHPRREDGSVDYSKVEPCECVKESLERRRVHWMLRNCELPSDTGKMTFEKFQVLPGLEEAYDAALAVAEEVDDSNWLTLMSDADRGKTHLLIAVCRRWLARGRPARYAYVPLLLDELRRGFREEGDHSYESRFDFFLNVPLLALDDLGTESGTDWVDEKLDTIIDYRLVHGLPLMVTTNRSLDELPFRLSSRLRRRGKIIYIDAPEFMERKDKKS